MFHHPGLLSMRPTVSGFNSGDMTRVCVCVRARVHVHPGLAAAIVGNRNACAHHRIKQGLVHTRWTTLCQPYAQWAHVFLFTCGQAGGNRSYFRQPRGGGRVRNRKATTTQLATVQCVRRHCTRTARSEPICAHGWCECHQTESIPCADFKLGARAARQDRVF